MLEDPWGHISCPPCLLSLKNSLRLQLLPEEGWVWLLNPFYQCHSVVGWLVKRLRRIVRIFDRNEGYTARTLDTRARELGILQLRWTWCCPPFRVGVESIPTGIAVLMLACSVGALVCLLQYWCQWAGAWPIHWFLPFQWPLYLEIHLGQIYPICSWGLWSSWS